MGETIHGGKFHLWKHGFSPLAHFTFTVPSVTTVPRRDVTGSFAAGSVNVQFKTFYRDQNSPSPFTVSFKGVTVTWDEWPTDEQHVFVTIISGYEIDSKDTVLVDVDNPTMIIQPSSNKPAYIYVAIATETLRDPQMELGECVTTWPSAQIIITPGPPDFENPNVNINWKLYLLGAADHSSLGQKVVPVKDITNVQGNTWVVSNFSQSRPPSGNYIFGQTGSTATAAVTSETSVQDISLALREVLTDETLIDQLAQGLKGRGLGLGQSRTS